MIKAFNIPIAQNNEEKKEYRWQVAVSLLILFVSFSLANVAFLREVNRLKVEAGNIG